MIKKYTDPRIKAEALAKAIKKLGDASHALRKASVDLREATEDALQKFGKLGIAGSTASDLIAAICAPLFVCGRCGAEQLAKNMSGEHCLDCSAALQRVERSKQFS